MLNAYALTFIFAFVIQIVFFLFTASLKTDKLTDLAYGITFVILAWFLYLTRSSMLPAQLILTLTITAWGLRLAGYLLIRILRMGRDQRFDDIRHKWWSFLKFWLFQALAIWAIMLPSTYSLTQTQLAPLNWLSWLGLVIFTLGWGLETVADWQKFVFKNQSQNKDRWIESGVWRYSRHPNYFGEMSLWWGLFLFTHSWQSGWSWLTIIGPVFITFILIFVSGVPPLERRYAKKYRHNDEYHAYAQRTNLLLPWWPRQKS